MQTLEQVLRQYALNPLVQTKIELFEGRKPEVSPCASPATTPDAASATFICFRCDEEHDMQDAHTTLNGPLCTNCVNAASLEAAAVRSTAESSLANNTMAHTPAVIGKLNISNPA